MKRSHSDALLTRLSNTVILRFGGCVAFERLPRLRTSCVSSLHVLSVPATTYFQNRRIISKVQHVLFDILFDERSSPDSQSACAVKAKIPSANSPKSRLVTIRCSDARRIRILLTKFYNLAPIRSGIQPLNGANPSVNPSRANVAPAVFLVGALRHSCSYCTTAVVTHDDNVLDVEMRDGVRRDGFSGQVVDDELIADVASLRGCKRSAALFTGYPDRTCAPRRVLLAENQTRCSRAFSSHCNQDRGTDGGEQRVN